MIYQLIFLPIHLFCILLVYLIFLLVYRFFYYRKYTTKNGWSKCDKCQKSKETMYYSNKWFGRIYQCGKCVFEHDR